MVGGRGSCGKTVQREGCEERPEPQWNPTRALMAFGLSLGLDWLSRLSALWRSAMALPAVKVISKATKSHQKPSRKFPDGFFLYHPPAHQPYLTSPRWRDSNSTSVANCPPLRQSCHAQNLMGAARGCKSSGSDSFLPPFKHRTPPSPPPPSSSPSPSALPISRRLQTAAPGSPQWGKRL